MDSRSPRDGRVLEEIGLYHPIEKLEKQVSISAAKVKDWMARGATPSTTVKELLNRKRQRIVGPPRTRCVSEGVIRGKGSCRVHREDPRGRPDGVVVNMIEGEKSTILELKVADSDIGKVIGKHGRIAKAVRTLLSAARRSRESGWCSRSWTEKRCLGGWPSGRASGSRRHHRDVWHRGGVKGQELFRRVGHLASLRDALFRKGGRERRLRIESARPHPGTSSRRSRAWTRRKTRGGSWASRSGFPARRQRGWVTASITRPICAPASCGSGTSRSATVRSVWDGGPAQLLEVQEREGKTFLVPFTDHFIGEVDVPGGRIS